MAVGVWVFVGVEVAVYVAVGVKVGVRVGVGVGSGWWSDVIHIDGPKIHIATRSGQGPGAAARRHCQGPCSQIRAELPPLVYKFHVINSRTSPKRCASPHPIGTKTNHRFKIGDIAIKGATRHTTIAQDVSPTPYNWNHNMLHLPAAAGRTHRGG